VRRLDGSDVTKARAPPSGLTAAPAQQLPKIDVLEIKAIQTASEGAGAVP
jgi:hypothetical protein